MTMANTEMTAGEYTSTSEPDDSRPDDSSRYKMWLGEISSCKQEKRDLIDDWSTNTDYRRGKNSDAESDATRLPFAIDWAYTKTKQASLFSQVPQVIVNSEPGEDSPYKPAFPVFQKRLNYRKI